MKPEETLKRFFFNHRGLTLLEVLIAIAIASVLAIALYGSFFSVLKARKTIAGELEAVNSATRFLDSISREIQSAYFKDANKKTFFEGEKKELLGSTVSTVRFTAFLRLSASGDIPGGDLVAIRYSVEKDQSGALTLYRESWNPYLINENETNGIVKTAVMENIDSFDVSYLSGQGWAGAWDSSAEKTKPYAVKATVSLKDAVKREYSIIARTMIQ